MIRRGRAPAVGAATTPRLSLRRALAFGVDAALAWALVLLLSLPLRDTGLRLPQPFPLMRVANCAPLAPPAWLLAARGAGEAIALSRLCLGRLLGLPDGAEVVAVFETVDGSQPDRALRQPVHADLSPAPDLAGLPGLLVLAVLGLGNAALTATGRPSPGKALAGLRLQGPPRRAALREALRLGPLALPPLLTLAAAQGLLAPPILWDFATALALAAGAAAFGLWYYLWPLLRGATGLRHDRLSGFRLVRAG